MNTFEIDCVMQLLIVGIEICKLEKLRWLNEAVKFWMKPLKSEKSISYLPKIAYLTEYFTNLKFDNFLFEGRTINSEGGFHGSLILAALLQGLCVVDLVLLMFGKYL